MKEYLFIVMVAAIVTYAATPLMRTLAIRLKAYTPVRDRDVHRIPIPRLGGVGMFLGFGSAVLVAHKLPFLRQVFDNGNELWGVLAGAGLVCLIGAIDDIRELGALTKLAGQLLAAGVMAYEGVQLVSLPLAETTVLPAPILAGLTVLAVVFSTNAVNFVDGLDGLAAGIVGIAGISFFVYAYLVGQHYNPANVFTTAAFISAAIIGCCVGFLPHNFYPARIFMGDSGALLLGLLLAAAMISVTGTVDAADLSASPTAATYLPLILPITIFLLPVADLLLAVIRRTRAGRRPWQPDALHLHHRMLQIGHGHRRAVLLLWSWAAVTALGSVSFVFLEPALAAGLAIGGLVVVGLLTVFLPRLGFANHQPRDIG